MELRTLKVVKDTQIQYSSKELLFLAQSGQPYRGTLYINFLSKGTTINLIDLKKYITSLRSKVLNSENIAYEIYEKINTSITTNNLGVIVDLSARGGIQQRVSYGKDFQTVLKPNIFQV